MAERTYLHVGTPKSGTTYLQEVLWRAVDPLRENNVLLPHRFNTHYLAAKGVTGRQGVLRETSAAPASAWPRLARQVNEWPGDAVISHELFAPATAEQATQAKSMLTDTEVHVLITARALHKQIPASWQEQLRSGLATPYADFLDRVRDGTAKGRWFWLVQDLADIAERWATDIRPEHVHIVTVPRHDADGDLLWRRFAHALGIDADRYDSEVPRRDVFLGPVESELLRRIHAARDPRFTDASRHRWTRRLLASRILGRGPDSSGTYPRDAIRLPDHVYDWLVERQTTMLAAVRDAGYQVMGDLADLEVDRERTNGEHVATASESEIEDASDWTIARLQEHLVYHCRPKAQAPSVGPGDGVAGILELLEHIRAADTGATPRPQTSATRFGGWDRRVIRRLTR